MKIALAVSTMILTAATAFANGPPTPTVASRTPVATRFAALRVTPNHYIGVVGENGIPHVLRPDGHLQDIYVTESLQGPRVVIRTISRVSESGKPAELVTMVGAPFKPLRVLHEVQNGHVMRMLDQPVGVGIREYDFADPLVSGAPSVGRDNLVRLIQQSNNRNSPQSLFGRRLSQLESVNTHDDWIIAKTVEGYTLAGTGLVWTDFTNIPPLTSRASVFSNPIHVQDLPKLPVQTVDVSGYNQDVASAVLVAARLVSARAIDGRWPTNVNVAQETIKVPNPARGGELMELSGITVSLDRGEVILLSPVDGHLMWSGSLRQDPRNGGC